MRLAALDMFASRTLRKIFSQSEKIEFNQKISDTVGEAFRLPLRTLKKILTSITDANGKISLPQGEGYVGVHSPTEIYGQINVGRCLGAAVANDLGKKRREPPPYGNNELMRIKILSFRGK